jgi:hypothetical protein
VNEFLNGEFAPLITGVALALIALAVVLAPVLQGASEVAPRRDVRANAPRLEIDDEPIPGSAIEALREIEFDRATGKLSDTDYAALKQRYTGAALEELRAREAGGIVVAAPGAIGAPADDLAEARIRKYRGYAACGTCGPRPESDALFCSTCGTYLPGACEQCGEHVSAAGSRFCTHCGHQLAA